MQWMTAGKVSARGMKLDFGSYFVIRCVYQGCVHGEMFPLVNDKAPNTLKLFQVLTRNPFQNSRSTPTTSAPSLSDMDEPCESGQVC